MSQSIRRSVVSEFVIGAGLTVGLYALVVQPIESELASAERVRDAVAAEQRRVEQSTLEPAEARRRLGAWDAKRARLEALGAPAQTEAELMAAIADLTREHGVRIELVQPEPVAARTGAKGATAAAGGTGVAVSHRLGQSLTVSATYPAVVAFIEALEHRTGLTRVREVHVSPSGPPGANEVTAVIRTEHLAVTATVAAAEGSGGGQEAGR